MAVTKPLTLTTPRQYDPKSGLPVLPEGYFWRVAPNWATGTPYLYLMQVRDYYFFKTNRPISEEILFLGQSSNQLRISANEILNRRQSYGDYR